jgi:hypothetical protein
MEKFVLGAAVVMVAAKVNMVVAEVVAARVTVRGMADGMQGDSRRLCELPFMLLDSAS